MQYDSFRRAYSPFTETTVLVATVAGSDSKMHFIPNSLHTCFCSLTLSNATKFTLKYVFFELMFSLYNLKVRLPALLFCYATHCLCVAFYLKKNRCKQCKIQALHPFQAQRFFQTIVWKCVLVTISVEQTRFLYIHFH